jgi:hypothetical protein
MRIENVIQCRVEHGAPLPVSAMWRQGVSVRFAYCPGGVHNITAGFCGPVTKNRNAALTLTVDVDPERDAAVCQASLDAIKAGRPGQEPYGCFEHDEKQASVWASRFDFGPDPVRGEPAVLLEAKPSGSGADAVNRKDWRSWSPSFGTDADYSKCMCSLCSEPVASCECAKPALYFPAGVRGSAANPAHITGVAFVLGTLTNRPAFAAMPPVKAKHQGSGVTLQCEDALARVTNLRVQHDERVAELLSRVVHAR